MILYVVRIRCLSPQYERVFAFSVSFSIKIAQKVLRHCLHGFSLISAHILPGIMLIVLAYAGNHPYYCVAIITASLGFNGASTLTNLQNSQDLAPNFAGTLYGTINFVGTTTGFITPMVVGHFTAERVSVVHQHAGHVLHTRVECNLSLIWLFFTSTEHNRRMEHYFHHRCHCLYCTCHCFYIIWQW